MRTVGAEGNRWLGSGNEPPADAVHAIFRLYARRAQYARSYYLGWSLIYTFTFLLSVTLSLSPFISFRLNRFPRLCEQRRGWPNDSPCTFRKRVTRLSVTLLAFSMLCL